MSSSENVQRKPQFSGKKKEDYPLYKMQLEAYLVEAGCTEAILESFNSSLPATEKTALDPADATEKAQKKAREMNAKVMRALILGIGKNKAMLNAITMSKEPGWSGGKVWKVIKELDRRFSPSDAIGLMEMVEEIAKIKLGHNEDLETIVDKLAAIQVQYGAILLDKK